MRPLPTGALSTAPIARALGLSLGLSLLLIACGDDSQPVEGDAGVIDAAGGDASPDTCYRELDDRGNGATPEATGLAFGVGRVAVCGSVAIDHPGASYLDIDRYQLAVSSAGPALLRFTAPAAAGLDRIDVLIHNATGPVAAARVHGGVGVTLLPLATGLYTIAVEVQGASNAVVPYQLELVADDPDARCPMPAFPAPDYTETETVLSGHRANDVVSIRTSPAVVSNLTALLTDIPEDTVLAVSAGARQTIAGTSADVVSLEDSYRDRDTFAFYTGQNTNLLEVRATWPGALADLDLFVFDATRPDDPMGRPAIALTGELVVTAVKPATRYWIWVGGSPRSSRLPADYSLALCGSEIAVSSNF